MSKLNRRKLCECNTCGLYVKPGRRFISGHNGRIHPVPIPNHHPCECPCGELVASNRRFINHHSRRGIHLTEETLQKLRRPHGPHTEETKQKMRKPHGPFTEEQKQNMREAQKIAQNKPDVKEKKSKSEKIAQNRPDIKERRLQSFRITNAEPEVKAKRSRSAKKNWQNPIHRKKMIEIRNQPETEAKRKQSTKITNAKTEIKEKRSQVAKIALNKPKVKLKRAQTETRPEIKEKRSQSKKKNWADPIYRKNQLIAFGKGLNVKPNKPETLLRNNFIYWWPKIIYSGDYSVIINGRNPDFICEELKKIIEFNGSYWHRNDILGEREKIFAEVGYDTLILVDEDLLDMDKLKIKVDAFMRR